MAVVTRSPLIAGGTEGGPLGKRQVAGVTLRQPRVWVAWKVFRGHFELGRGPAPSMTVTDGQRRGPRLRPFPPLRLPAAPGHPVVAGLRPQRPASGFSPSLSASSCPPLTSSQPEALPRPISKRGHSMRSWVDMKFLRHHSTRYGGDTDPLLVHSFPPVS